MNNYKKFIFDIDYTILIPDWSKEDDYFRECIPLEEQERFFELKQSIMNKYELEYPRYDTKTLSDFFKSYNLTVSEDVINGWMIHNGETIIDEVVDGVKDLFKYLKDNGKEIVILTSWFSGTQIPRLKRAGLYEYIDKIVAGEDAMKPDLESFTLAIGDTPKSDCIMIGDSIKSDKNGADNAGIDSYIVDKNNTIRDILNILTGKRVIANYNECLTNLACSISKYFGASFKHNTLDYVDKILEEKKPKNVVTILFDGMGSYILDKHLNKDSFFMKNKLKNITSVFPATTVAATTSIRTGLNPCETGMLGWTMYFDECKDTFVSFFGTRKTDETWTPVDEALEYSKKYLRHKEVIERINEETNNKGYKVMPFDSDSYTDLDNMFEKIESLVNSSDDKKYIYAYNDEPDHSMHDFGTFDIFVGDLIREREKKVFELSMKLKDTIIFVIADHGHLEEEDYQLVNYPDIVDCLRELPSIEPRATAFFIKEGMNERFEELFNKYFSEDYNLYTKEEVINNKFFGDGEENPKFRSELGDYLAISHSKKAFIYDGDCRLKSHHAGNTRNEVFIPLIVIDTNEVNEEI
ncbi:MAG: HAD hydrolase-like protein [Bacilli bacterium]|nr:HAD hydrolase-like protein [Bacilli bacterium]